jgi:hypothetical protein
LIMPNLRLGQIVHPLQRTRTCTSSNDVWFPSCFAQE